MTHLAAIVASLSTAFAGANAAPQPFAIEVVDEETGRGVPLVELTTTNNQRFVTDSGGLAAIDAPDLLGQAIYFHVRSHGYEYAKDGFGYRGKALKLEPGGRAQLKLKRINVAKRLYRLTGGGIYRDTAMLGRPAPIREPLLNAQVFGCDTIMAAVYKGKARWFWGDTNKPSYPLGHFHITGATTPLPEGSKLEPARGIDYDYFVGPEGFARPTCQMPGDGPTWIGGLTVLRDKDGRERMYAGYVKIKPPLEAYKHGLVVWDDEQDKFVEVTAFPDGLPIYLDSQNHPFRHAEPGGAEFNYYTNSFPLVRVRPDPEALADPRGYEGFSCLKPGTRPEDRQLDRDEGGRLRYAWKANTPPLPQQDQDKLIKSGLMKPEEALIALRDVETGRPVMAHFGSVYWNEHRGRWVQVVSEAGGESSYLGEIWFAEADAPTGPWVYARKIATHEKYSFYNPKHHPFLDEDGGRVIYFEGTYTNSFSGNPDQTPRYDYNQVLYQLDLDDPRLNLPVAFDADPAPRPGDDGGREGRRVGFFALERPGPGSVPVFEVGEGEDRAWVVGEAPQPAAAPKFHALPADSASPPATTAPLHEFRREGGAGRAYATVESLEGYRRSEKPLCRVWINPIGVVLPGR
jgi:hypothetical protein